MKKLSLILGFSILMASTIYARECSTYEKDKAEYFAEQAGQQIVDDIGGAVDLYTKLVDCKFNAYSNRFKLKVEVHFNGQFIRSNHYEVDGILKLNSDGSQVSFAQTWANDNFKKLVFWEKMAAGVIILSNIANKSNDSYETPAMTP